VLFLHSHFNKHNNFPQFKSTRLTVTILPPPPQARSTKKKATEFTGHDDNTATLFTVKFLPDVEEFSGSSLPGLLDKKEHVTSVAAKMPP
jgi:hypothetical protein